MVLGWKIYNGLNKNLGGANFLTMLLQLMSKSTNRTWVETENRTNVK